MAGNQANPAYRKLWKKSTEPSQRDMQVAQALVDLEATSNNTLPELKKLQFTRCVDLKVDQKTALVIFLPYIHRKKVQENLSKLSNELSKKLSISDIVFIAERVILPRSFVRRKGNQRRPRSRTLTSVHEAILEDIVHPAQIVGKRTKIHRDGKRMMQVTLRTSGAAGDQDKHKIYAAVYKKFCNKNVVFQSATN